MKKKILIIAMALILVSGTFLPAEADTNGSSYESYVSLLSSLGIIRDNESFDPESDVTRAEMTSLVIRMLGMDDLGSGRNVFNDVTPKHPSYNDITVAYDMGIINGVDNTAFLPDEPAKYGQAVKMIVCALGYSVQAESLGGYPAGYLSKASVLGILDGVSNKDDGIKKKDVAVMAANALDVSLLKRLSFGSTYTFDVDSDSTILSSYLKVTKRKGMITANYAVSVSGTNVKKDEIELGGLIFKTGGSDLSEMVGKNVTIYTKRINEVDTVLHSEENSTNITVTIDAFDISYDTTTSKLCYETDGKTKYETIEPNAKLVYNGRPVENWTKSDLMPDSGSVTLIAPAGGNFEIIIVWSYINLIVERTNSLEETIYFKSPPLGMNSIDLGELADKLTFFDTNNAVEKLENCKEWDIISVAKSHDDKKIKLIRSGAKLTGKITEINDEEASVDGIKCKIAKSLTINSGLVQLQLGLEGSFSLDFDGNIAAYNKSNVSGTMYGYLVSASMTKGLDSHPEIKIFTEGNEMRVYATTNIVIIESMSGRSSVKMEDILNPGLYIMDADGKLIEQLIRYQTTNGKISLIELARDGSALNEAEKKQYFSADEVIGSAYYLPGIMKSFLSRYMVSDSTKVFNVPVSYGGDDDAYAVLDPDLLTQKYYSNLAFYDINEDNTISAFVIHESISAGTIDARASIGVVTDVYKSLNNDGENIIKIKVYTRSGETVEMYGDEDKKALFGTGVITDLSRESQVYEGKPLGEIYISQIKKGDVVQYTTLQSGEISSIALRLRSVTPLYKDMGALNASESETTKDLAYKDCLITYAKVIYASSEAVKMYIYSPNKSEKWIRVHGYESTPLVLYDRQKGTIKAITYTEIYPDDDIFVYRWTQNNGLMVVYR